MKHIVSEGDVVIIHDTSWDCAKRIGEPFEAIVLWRGINGQPLVTKMGEYKPFWSSYASIVEIDRHINLNKLFGTNQLINKGEKRDMAKIFRFSGYFVENTNIENIANFEGRISELCMESEDIIQQLHIEESEEFEADGELEENCDLALLTRHFKSFCDSAYNFDRPIPQKGEKYKHFKLGKIVTIIGISRHTETEEISVVYDYEGHIWNRPLEMFMSEVDKKKYPDAEQKYRFELLENTCEK